MTEDEKTKLIGDLDRGFTPRMMPAVHRTMVWDELGMTGHTEPAEWVNAEPVTDSSDPQT